MVDVICIGNALIDSFLTIHEANQYCRYDKETGEFCVKAGEKIPLEDAQFELGGNACNVAVGLARLGLQSALVAEIGNDAFAHKIKKQLEMEGVNLSHLITSDASSSFGISINFKNERTLFVWHVERKHQFDYDAMQTKWMYLSSMGDTWRHVYREVPPYIRKTQHKLAFNPGTRQIAAGGEVLEPVLSVTDILFVNKEEAERIAFLRHHVLEGTNKEQIKLLAEKLQTFGPKIIVITDGQHGSFVLDEKGEFYVQPIIDAPVISKTGAGDSFSASFLAATIYGHDIPTAMKWGAYNSASVIGKVGAQSGLLTKEQLMHKV